MSLGSGCHAESQVARFQLIDPSFWHVLSRTVWRVSSILGRRPCHSRPSSNSPKVETAHLLQATVGSHVSTPQGVMALPVPGHPLQRVECNSVKDRKNANNAEEYDNE